MNQASTDEIISLLNACSEAEHQIILDHLRKLLPLHPLEEKWGLSAEIILDAISRSSDLTLRGVRGIIAEAAFANVVALTLAGAWDINEIEGDQSYDFLLKHGRGTRATIQVKLQRKERQQPKQVTESLRRRLSNPPDTLYVVEVQRTRGGKRTLMASEESTMQTQDTRPYRFGEFDILAVNMHPSTNDWSSFMYTVGTWLLPRSQDSQKHLINIFQPVASQSDEYWTSDINQCIEWFLRKEKRLLYGA